MTSLAYTADDPVGLVKALVAYAKDHPVFQFKAGVVEGRVLDVDAINQLATLPGKEELYAQAAVRHQLAGAARGEPAGRPGARPGHRDQPGGREEKVCGLRIADRAVAAAAGELLRRMKNEVRSESTKEQQNSWRTLMLSPNRSRA